MAGGDGKGYKLINLNNLSIYWDHDLLGDLEGEEFMVRIGHTHLLNFKLYEKIKFT